MEQMPSYVLVNLSPVLDLIFSYLSARYLSQAAQVCTVWSTAVKRELKKRHWWDTGLIVNTGADSDGYNQNQHEEFKNEMDYFFNELRLLPNLVLALTCTLSDDDYDDDDGHDNGDDDDHNFNNEDECIGIPIDKFNTASHNFKKLFIPKNCTLMSAYVGGVIGKQYNPIVNNSGKTVEIESEKAVSLLCLKPSMKIKYKKFAITAEKINKIKKKDINIFDAINFNVSKEENIVLLLFIKEIDSSIYQGRHKVRKMISGIKKIAENKKIIVIGGYTDTIYESTEEIKQGIMGIIFYGDNINAALHIHSDDSLTNLKYDLKTMKSKVIKNNSAPIVWGKDSLMLMVSCVERGERYYNKQNVESGIVNEVFPNLPVFGFFGVGEVAFDTSNMDKYPACNYAYTSVFCLINFA